MATRTKRGGSRLRDATGKRTRKQDCCCDPILCDTINDEATRATWEISYEIHGLTIGSETCGGSCNSVGPLSGVIPYNGGGFSLDWGKEVTICGALFYFMAAGIRCTSGTVTLELSLGVSDGGASTWAIGWLTTVPQSSFILGSTFTLPRSSSQSVTPPGCLPTPSNGIGTTCDFTVSAA